MSVTYMDKKRHFNCAQDGRDYLLLAEQLSIKKSTAITLVRRLKLRNGVISLPCGGAHNTKVDVVMKRAVISYVEKNCQISLREIKAQLEHHHQTKPHISTITILKVLDGSFYSLKKVSIQTRRKMRKFFFVLSGLTSAARNAVAGGERIHQPIGTILQSCVCQPRGAAAHFHSEAWARWHQHAGYFCPLTHTQAVETQTARQRNVLQFGCPLTDESS